MPISKGLDWKKKKKKEMNVEGKKRDNHFLSQEVLIRLKDQQGARGVLLSSCVLPPGSAATRVPAAGQDSRSFGADSTV